jgi:hypothetical protein
VIERLCSIEKPSHADATRSIWVSMRESVVIVAIAWHAAEGCRAIRAAIYTSDQFILIQ